MEKIGKRLTAALISAALTLTNMGSTLGTVYAASYGETVDFSVRGTDMAEAIMDRIQELDGNRRIAEAEDLEFSEGRTEKYNQMFFEKEGNLYEFYPEIEGQDQEASVRTFIRLPEEADENYELTGEEQLVFLYENGSDSTLRFSTAIEHENGKIQKTNRIAVRSYEDAFGEDDNYLSEEETEVKESESETVQEMESEAVTEEPKDEAGIEEELPDGEVDADNGEAVEEHSEDGSQPETSDADQEESSASKESQENGTQNSDSSEEQTAPAETEESEESSSAGLESIPEPTESDGTEASTEESEEETSEAETQASTGAPDVESTSVPETEDGNVLRPVRPASPSELPKDQTATSSQPLKDQTATPSQSQNNAWGGGIFQIQSHDLVGIGGSITAKAYITSVDRLKLLDDWRAGAESVFDIADLLAPDYPWFTILDEAGNEIETAEVEEDGVIKIYQNKMDETGNYLPLPREIETAFQLNYGMEYSEDEELKKYAVKEGDRFTYELPQGIIYEERTDVDVYFGSNVVGRMSISEDGRIDIEMLQNVGAHFKGQLRVKGSVDFSKEEEGKPEITIQVGTVDKTLVFPEIQPEEHKSISITKTYHDAEDLHISGETGLVDAVRYHLTVTAGENNTGDLTNIVIADQYSGNVEAGDLAYGESVAIEAVSEGSTIASAVFENTESLSSRRIRLLDHEGNPGALRPGEQVKLSYQIHIKPEAWFSEDPKKEESGKKVSSYIRVSFDNTATVTAEDGAVKGTAKASFAMSKKLVSKSGIVHRDEVIGGEQVPFCIEYNVFVNPELLNMTDWTVKDTLPETAKPEQQQHYVGEVVVRAYERAGGNAVKTDRFDVEDGSLSWEYTVPADFSRYYLQFTYYTDIQSPDGSNSENTIQMIAPLGSGFPGTKPGSTHIEHTYNTYKLEKNTTGWADNRMGTIGWRAVLSKYVNGVENADGAAILAGARFSDTLSVFNDQGKLNHTFKDKETFKEGLTIKDKNGEQVTGFEIDTFSENSFTIRFTEDALSPVTIEYKTYVTDKKGNQDFFEWLIDYTVSFRNNAVLEPEGTAKEQADAELKMSTANGFLRKQVHKTDAQTGTIQWKLECNVGGYKMDLSQVGEILIRETLPEGLELVNIYPEAHSGLMLREGEDYTAEGNTVMLNVSRAAEYIRSSGKGFNLAGPFYFIVETRVNDPSKKEFTNRAEMMIQGIKLPEVSAAANLDANFLSKDMAYDSYTAPYAKYTLLVNQPASALRTDGGTLTVKDTLGSKHMVFRPGSIRVSNSQTKEAIDAGIAVSGQTCTISGLPDATPITITYEVMFNGAVGSSFAASNHAELSYGVQSSVEAEHSESVKLVRPSASVEGDYFIELSKTDQWGQPLTGAEFTLYELKKNENGTFTVVSDALGIYQPVLTEDGGRTSVMVEGLKSGKAYRLEETKVPDGYADGEKTVDLYIPTGSEESLPEEENMIYLYNPGYPVIVANQKQTGNIELTKTVEGQDPDAGESAVFYFTVSDGERYFDEHGTMSEEKQVISLSYIPNERNSIIIKNLPFGDYIVTEVENLNGDPISDEFRYEVSAGANAGDHGTVTVEAGKTQGITFVNTVKEEPPADPETDPGQPETQPGEPETEPGQPETQPNEPETEAPVIPGGGSGGGSGSGGSGGGSSTTGRGTAAPEAGGPGEIVNIMPEEVPLAQWPDKQGESFTILDENVPLAPLPKTGEEEHKSHLVALVSALMLGVYFAVHGKKRKES